MEESSDGLPSAPRAMIGQFERNDTCAEHGDFVSKGFAFGKHTHWISCPQCSSIKQAEADAESAKVEAGNEQRRIEARLDRSGIPLRYGSKSFETFIADTPGKERALSAAMSFAHQFDRHLASGTTMVFSGLPGTGKSHLATSIAQSIMGQHTALYTSAIDAVRMIRDTWRRGSEKTETEVLNALSFVDLLILDEVGVQYGTEAEQVSLFDIIDKRYRDLMPMILLTNQNKAGMKAFLGDRSFDRLREGGEWVTFDWVSQRGSAAS